MFRLKLGLCIYVFSGSKSVLEFLFLAFVVKDCSFDQKRQVSCFSFVQFS